MEYYGCNFIRATRLSIMGQFDLPLDHEKNQTAIALCCENEKIPGVPFGKTPEETLERFLGMRDRLILRGRADSIAEDIPCAKCHYYTKKDWGLSMQISHVSLAMTPAPCQCKCFYCTQAKRNSNGWEKNSNIAAGYEATFALLDLAQKENIISPNALWNFASGEITIHPYKKQFMELIRNKRVLFLTNGFIFDEDIAQELHNNPCAMINVSLDAGTAETWHKVKGVNNFPQVINNLKKYSAVACNPKQITLKYIILPGINDSDEDFFSFIELEKSYNMSFASISRDNRIFKDAPPSELPLSKRIFDYNLIESSARFLALHTAMIAPVAFSNFTEEEQHQAVILAEKILKSI